MVHTPYIVVKLVSPWGKGFPVHIIVVKLVSPQGKGCLVHITVVKLVSPWGKECLGLPIPLSCYCHSDAFSTHQ